MRGALRNSFAFPATLLRTLPWKSTSPPTSTSTSTSTSTPTLTSVLVAIAVAFACASCTFTSTCNRDPDEETVKTGKTVGNTYISAPNDGPREGPTHGPWAHFPPARTLTFEHHLGAAPPDIDIWLAFHDQGILAPSAGNLSLLEYVDAQIIQIKNDTCSEVWVWLVASIPALPAPLSPQADAGASSSASGASGASGAESL